MRKTESSLDLTMKYCVLSLLLALGCVLVHGAPVEKAGMEQGSCEDAQAMGAAGLALTKINQDRQDGYILSLHRLSNVHMTKHGETGVVFYLTMNVVETNCSVLSRKDWKTCEARPTHDTPVYGQCKAAIYINKVQRVVRLYKYDCAIRPAPAAKVSEICPDCPSHIALDNAEVQKAVSLSLAQFNKESSLASHFALLKVNRATSGMAMAMYYNVEYTIQETTCPKSKEAADKCPLMQCEFAHKGLCKGKLIYTPTGDAEISVTCEIYEPEAAEREKRIHLLGGETDHSHNDTHTDGHDHAHAADKTHTHDHAHDHTKDHAHHDQTPGHTHNDDHHHTHDHEAGSGHTHAHDDSHDHGHDHDHAHAHAHDHSHDHKAGSGHRHAHDHSHDHGHGHDHAHAHHAKAHDHSADSSNQHHDYKHTDGAHTHQHDHELALDHDHKHAHLHEHEHHHHHHGHDHETTGHDHPEGAVRMLPAMDQPMTLPAFPDVPAGGPKVPLKPDPQIPGVMEPTIEAFPTSVSSSCSPPLVVEATLVEKLFAEDLIFKSA